MKNKITNNLGLKILAVLFSCALWLIVVNINDPVSSKTFSGIPVTIKNSESITRQGKVYAILDDTDTVDVTVRASRSTIDALDRENIKAVADVNELTFMDTVEIKLSSDKYNDKLESITSTTENLKLNIENMKVTQLVVNSMTTGEPAAGYVLGNVTTDQNLIVLSGPESIISQVSRVEANVNVEGMTSDISTDVKLKLYDVEGTLIENGSITKNIDSVNVHVPIYATKIVPIQYTTVGEPAAGYALSGEVIGTPNTVTIAGKQAAIDAITMIEVPELNIAGQNSDVVTTIKIKDYLPENVHYIGKKADAVITVTAKIAKEAVKTFTIPSRNITVANVDADTTAILSNTEEAETLEVVGLPEIVNGLKPESIVGVADMKELKETLGVDTIQPGIYQVPVTVQLPEGVTPVVPLIVEIQVKHTAE
ncbi:MAG: CdaR family protein [Lachnospiraceae bacterium]